MDRIDYDYIASLVEGAQYGSSDAFAELYAATYQKTYRFACRYLRDESAAEDALQETYIMALRKIGELQDPKLFISWLSRIAFRICFNIRQAQERTNLPDSEKDHLRNAGISRSPEEILVEVDQRQFLVSRIMGLPATEAQVLVLYYYHNNKIADIAGLMEISERSVKRYLKSGRERLNRIMTR